MRGAARPTESVSTMDNAKDFVSRGASFQASGGETFSIFFPCFWGIFCASSKADELMTITPTLFALAE
jgi:hypothetical protein